MPNPWIAEGQLENNARVPDVTGIVELATDGIITGQVLLNGNTGYTDANSWYTGMPITQNSIIEVVSEEYNSEAKLFWGLPSICGYYCLGSESYPTKIAAYSKPNKFHRFMLKTFMGIRWENAA